MTVNLLRFKDELLSSFEKLLKSEKENDWILYAYDGSSNALKVDCCGENGVDELRDNLNGGKLMYGLLRIRDPSSNLLKLVLVHWQGGSVPSIRLGQYASHIHEVKKFFKGVSLTHYARNEEDVDLESIMKNFKTVNYGANAIVPEDVSKKPLASGSVYEKVDVKKEARGTERDQFWVKAEQEEQRRLEDERLRLIAERKKKEEEQRKLQEIIHKNAAEQDAQRPQMVSSEIMRRERLQEVSEVIKPKSTLKSMWEEKTKIQPETPTTKKPVQKFVKGFTPTKENEPDIPKVEQTKQPESEKTANGNNNNNIDPGDYMIQKHEETTLEHNNNLNQNITQSFKKLIVSQVPRVEEPDDDHEADWEDSPKKDQQHYRLEPLEPVEPVKFTETTNHLGLRAQTLWDYQAADDTEISFNPGEVISKIERVDEGWWRGEAPDGKLGLFPANYVQLL